MKKLLALVAFLMLAGPAGAASVNRSCEHVNGTTTTHTAFANCDAELVKLYARAPIETTSTNVGNAISATSSPAVTSLTDGLSIYLDSPLTVTGPATLALDGLTARAIVSNAAAALVSGDLISGARYHLVYKSSITSWMVLTSLRGPKLVISSNLSDLASASTARTNLGLGTAAVLNDTAIGLTPDVQTFASTGAGTWNKPTGGQSMCRVEVWGAGGAGGRGQGTQAAAGGGGGGYKVKVFVMSTLATSESLSVGTGGTAPGGANSDGNTGGNTTFSSGSKLVTAYGGGGGAGATVGAGGGGGGGVGSQGTVGVATVGGSTDLQFTPFYGTPGGTGVATGNATAPISSYLGGAGGGGSTGDATGTNAAGGSADYGGGGGGSGAEDASPGPGAGGVSSYGGSGGAGSFDNAAATAGSQPGGGGGGSENGNAGAGGNGEVIVTCH